MNAANGPVGSDRPTSLRLLGGFELKVAGARVEVPAPGRRLLAYLAVQRRTLERSHVAGVLWPDTTDTKAASRLRSAVWRLQGVEPFAVHVTPSSLTLSPDVDVDVATLESTARALRARDSALDIGAIEVAQLGGELVPELWDAWLVFERERLRQVSVHALELLSQRLTERGDHERAVLAALGAVEVEPLRETANRRLVLAHLAEGNVTEAARSYCRYADLLRDELGLEPQPSFTDLIAPALLRRGA
jgi:DNA-binding SARP family transcriptional activator